MDRIFTIYRATNLENGKTYVGFDSGWPSRKNTHIKLSRTNKGGYAIHKAIRKYGEESFVWDVLYQSLDAVHTLNVMENYFIIENDSFGDGGYNLTLGGEGPLGLKHSEETRKKLSHPASDETKRKVSEAHRDKPLSEEHKRKISEALRGQLRSDEHRRNMSKPRSDGAKRKMCKGWETRRLKYGNSGKAA